MIVFVDLVVLLALILSAQIALGWSELASFPLQSDKSSLAGLGGVVLFMGMRWLGLAIALLIAVARGGLPWTEPPGTRIQVLLALGIHAGLGIVSYRGFEWITNAVQRDDPGPLKLAWLFGILLPLPVFLLTVWGAHRRSLPRHPIVAILVLVTIVLAHVAGWRGGTRR